MDGNGRMDRFLMNLMLASGGYPWTVIPVERRNDYLESLEAASTEQNIEPFINRWLRCSPKPAVRGWALQSWTFPDNKCIT